MKRLIIIIALVVAAAAYYYGVGTYKGEMEEVTISPDVVTEQEGVLGDVMEKGDIPAEVTGVVDQEAGEEQMMEKDGKITVAELSKHNTTEDCWVVYKNSVYDVTKFLPIHPGGVDKIAQFCGATDFEPAFTEQHGTSKADKLKNSAGKLQGEI